mgnify:FL=1|tara:strand:+ start:10 stop:561 length:552 start_codon:yes stop_codon:yes gene_type:complete
MANCEKCGCDDKFLPSPAPCPEPAACAETAQCSEVVDAKCTRYTGTAIACGTNTIVPQNTFIDAALANIITLICSNTTNKFIKEWTSLVTSGSGTAITITQAELTTCFGLRNGCFIPNGGLTPLQDKVDFAIDVYYYTTASSTWKRMTAEATTDITVNGTTGDITITLSSGSTYNKVRAVVIG